jgi:hypothetical protein
MRAGRISEETYPTRSTLVTWNVVEADPPGILTEAGPVKPVGIVTSTVAPAGRAGWLMLTVQVVTSPGSISAESQVRSASTVFGLSRMFQNFWMVFSLTITWTVAVCACAGTGAVARRARASATAGMVEIQRVVSVMVTVYSFT